MCTSPLSFLFIRLGKSANRRVQDLEERIFCIWRERAHDSVNYEGLFLFVATCGYTARMKVLQPAPFRFQDDLDSEPLLPPRSVRFVEALRRRKKSFTVRRSGVSRVPIGAGVLIAVVRSPFSLSTGKRFPFHHRIVKKTSEKSRFTPEH